MAASNEARPGRRGRRGPRVITEALVRDALSFIPADLGHDEAVRVAFALFDGIGDAGETLWYDWRGQRGTRSSEDAAEDRAIWKSARKPGSVKVGTLFGIAKASGFRFPPDDDDRLQTPAQPDPAAAAAARIELERKHAAEAAQYRARADQAAADSASMFEAASDRGHSEYLSRKGVDQAYGGRFGAGGVFLVPLRRPEDGPDGPVLNLQRIYPHKLAGKSTDKLLMPGGRKVGLAHWLSDPAGARVVLACEGFSTAASVRMAMGADVAVVMAVDAGNLVHVVKAVRATWSTVPILVCGDDDRGTEAAKGSNPGRKGATAAVRAARSDAGPARMVFPEGLPHGGTDWNDLAAHAGIEAVRAQIREALSLLFAGEVQELPRQRAQQPRGGTDDAAPGDEGPETEEGAPAGGGAPSSSDPFSVSDSGVWYVARDAEGNPKKPQWLCSRLDVTARTRADDANGWGNLLEFTDPDGNAKTWAMPSSMLSGDSSEWAARLRDMGLAMAPGTAARNLIARYIDTRRPEDRVTCTDRVGWHGPVFVLPSGCIGQAEGRRYVFQSDSGMEDTFRQRGELVQWRADVAAYCVGNSRLVFAVCCALAGPMLRPAGMESGGFHLRGNSSIGKTTGLKVAASVWGRPSYMQRWRTTDNALEATAVQHCDGLLILDEIGQVDGRVLGECAYMLANGQEKGRATRNAMPRKKRTWQLLYLSAGEVSMADHMAEAGKRTRAGMEVRMLDIPLDAGQGMGGIEDLHAYRGPADLSDAVVGAAAQQYGTAGRAWLEWACQHHATLPGLLQELIEDYREQLVPEAASEQVRRAGNRFALVAAAGELATRAGITGWPAGEALRGVRRCFNAWLAARGHLDNGEDAAMLRQVRNFLELHSEGRFTWWHRAADDHSPKTLNRAGFRRLLDDAGKPIKSDVDHQREYGDRMSVGDGERTHIDFILLREVFRQEVCRGFDPESVGKLLQRRGHLVHEPDRLMNKHRLPGIGKAACYHIKPSIFDDEL